MEKYSNVGREEVSMDIKKLHCDLVNRLSNYFSPKLDTWNSLLTLIEPYLEPAECYGNDIDHFSKICNNLMKRGEIYYGRYETLRQVVVKVDQRALPIIDDISKQIGDIKSQGNTSRRSAIHTTKFMVDDQVKKPEMISTRALDDSKEILRKNGIVLIKGASGDGKTCMCYQLLKWLMDAEDTKKEPIQLYNMDKWEKMVEPEISVAIFLDNINGDVIEELEKREVAIKSMFNRPITRRSNCLILNIRDEIFKSSSLSSCELFNTENIVDLRGRHCMTREEKHIILERYLPEIEKSLAIGGKSEIIDLAPNIGFPQCCRLYRDIPDNQREGFTFFKQPLNFMKTTLTKLPKEHFKALLFLFLNDGRVNLGDLDPNGEYDYKEKLEIVFGKTKLDFNDNVRSLRKSFVELLNSLVIKSNNYPFYKQVEDYSYYKFCHDSVQDTVALLYGTDTRNGFIKHCPRKFLSLISTSALQNRIMISSHDQCMYHRLAEELDIVPTYLQRCSYHKRSKFIASLDVWRDTQFLQGFIRWLNYQEPAKQRKVSLALLNGSCANTAEKCVFRLLSAGVRPNLVTPFAVVRGGSVEILERLLGYNVTGTARTVKSQSSHVTSNINVLHEACLFEKEDMVNRLCNTYPDLVFDTGTWGQSTLHLVAKTGNCGIFHKVEGCVLKSLSRVEDSQHRCISFNGSTIHIKCACSQYMIQLIDNYRGWTVLHSSCFGGHRTLCLYLCQIYPGLTTVTDGYGCLCLHYIARRSPDVEWFTECESYVRQYVESTGQTYDITTLRTRNGKTVLHDSCVWNNRTMSIYLCESYPALTTLQDDYGCICLHYIARYSSDTEWFTRCETYVKKYIEATGDSYDITVLLAKNGESVLDMAIERLKEQPKHKDNFGMTENNPLYEYLMRLFKSGKGEGSDFY